MATFFQALLILPEKKKCIGNLGFLNCDSYFYVAVTCLMTDKDLVGNFISNMSTII